MKPNVTLNQASFLQELFCRDARIWSQINVDDEKFWDKLAALTEKQYKFILALLYQSKIDKLIRVLRDMGFENKK